MTKLILRLGALYQLCSRSGGKSGLIRGRKFSVEAFSEVSVQKLSNRQRSSRISPLPPTSPSESSVSKLLENEKEKLQLKSVSQQLQDPLSNAILNEIQDEEYTQATDLELMDLKSDVERTFTINEKLLRKRITLVSSRINNDTHHGGEDKEKEDCEKNFSETQSTAKKDFRVTVDFNFDDVNNDYIKWVYHRNAMFKSFDETAIENAEEINTSDLDTQRKVPSKLRKKSHLAEKNNLLLDATSETINEKEIGINFSVSVEPYSVRMYRTKEVKSKILFSCIAGNYGTVIKRLKFISSHPNSTTGKAGEENISSVRFNSCRRSFQKECYHFVQEQLKIDNNLALFVLSYSQEKEQKEYFHWLENVLEFIPPPNEGPAASDEEILKSLLKQLKL
jgi:hypothetical protein